MATDFVIKAMDNPNTAVRFEGPVGFLSHYADYKLEALNIIKGWIELSFYRKNEKSFTIKLRPLLGETGVVVRSVTRLNGTALVSYQIVDRVLAENGEVYRYRTFSSAIEPTRVNQLELTDDTEYLKSQDFVLSSEHILLDEGQYYMIRRTPVV